MKRTNKKKIKKKSAGIKMPALFLFTAASVLFFIFRQPVIINPDNIDIKALEPSGENRSLYGTKLKVYKYKGTEVMAAVRPGKEVYHKTLQVPWNMILYDYARDAGGYVTYSEDTAQKNTVIFSVHVLKGTRQKAESGIPELVRRIHENYPDMKIRGQVLEE